MGRTLVIMNYEEEVEDPDYVYCMDLLHKTNTELSDMLDGVSTLLLSGGPQHVPNISDHPELKKEIQLIFAAAQRGIVVVGICLGFQLINCAFGNPVVRLPSPVIGCGKLNIRSVRTYADPLLECIDFEALAQGFSFHYDGVPEAVSEMGTLAVSSELQVVATGPDGIVYFVKHERFPIYGIQSHPEATVGGILDCLERYGEHTPVSLPSEEVLAAASATFFGAFGLSNPLD